MSGIRSLYRGPAAKGYSSAGSAPIRVDDTANTIKAIVAGTGTTEVEFLPTVLSPVTVVAATLTLAPATHAGRTVKLTSLTGCAVTLPAAAGTGAKYRLMIGVLPTSGSVSVAVASATDFMRGVAMVKADDAASTVIAWGTANTATVATESDTLTWNRTTTGAAAIGDVIELEDVSSAIWAITTRNNATGTEATPFTAAV